MGNPILMPDMIYGRVWEIDLSSLARRGISGLIVDVDNTLALPNHPEPYERVRKWISKAKEKGFSLIILSNNYTSRVAPFATKLGLKYVSVAMKPLTINYKKAAKMLQKTTGQIAVVGDQIFTDIMGGNLAHMFTVLVSPFERGSEGGWTFKIRRKLEKNIINSYKKQEEF